MLYIKTTPWLTVYILVVELIIIIVNSSTIGFSGYQAAYFTYVKFGISRVICLIPLTLLFMWFFFIFTIFPLCFYECNPHPIAYIAKYYYITIVVYLTPGLPFEYGTSLWMHKKTGLIDPATPKDARRLKMKFSQLRDLLEKESKMREKWVEIDRIGNRFNRMVAYPSGIFHSATKHFGSNMNNGRIYQTFRVGVDWNTFKMNP